MFIDPNQLSDVATIEFQLVTGDGTATGKSVYEFLAVVHCQNPEIAFQSRDCATIGAILGCAIFACTLLLLSFVPRPSLMRRPGKSLR